jgi:hypothetical protein
LADDDGVTAVGVFDWDGGFRIRHYGMNFISRKAAKTLRLGIFATLRLCVGFLISDNHK